MLVPVSVREKCKVELQRLQDLEVIAPLRELTWWVSQFVIAVNSKKSGEPRVSIDPEALNAAQKGERYQIPVIDELLPDLAGAGVFTKVDVASAFCIWCWTMV